MTWSTLSAQIATIADDWRRQRPERQQRRHLDPADFARLRDAGLLVAAAPVQAGGLWESIVASARPMCEVLRTLAAGDPSVALVSAMHPAVIGYWLAAPQQPGQLWAAQRAAVFASAAAGEQWGTITSEPGSGGDILLTRTAAQPDPAAAADLPGDAYLLSGEKHFGSGSGIADNMITTALPAGAAGPSVFVIRTKGRAWDGSQGMELASAWDGMGMAATQSHAMRLDACPAVRMAWDGPVQEITAAVAPFIPTLFTAVVLGVLDEAVRTAREVLAGKAVAMRAYEQVEWSRAELDHWLAVQAYEGALRAAETGDQKQGAYAALRAKEAVADLAESALGRITKVIGGATYSGRSPFAHWFEDVRALGFLRPPWGLAYDGLFATSLA